MNTNPQQYLDYSLSDLNGLNALHTAKEITQQLTLWPQLTDFLIQQQQALDAFLTPIMQLQDLQIILTGAGTSAFVGEAIATHLQANSSLSINAIASTDLVSNPALYLSRNIPTLLVSFARSGNSPESVAAVDIVDQLITDSHHLFITCNKQGFLASSAQQDPQRFCLMMPEQTNDQSFAMTSSYSCMYLSALHSFDTLSQINQASSTLKSQQRQLLSQSAKQVFEEFNRHAKLLANQSFERLVFLGSGGLQGNAREAALKCMELTAGKLIASYDSSLGFRHGPKFIVNQQTLVVVFRSNDHYTQQYDDDIIRELVGEGVQVLVITANSCAMDVQQLSTQSPSLPDVYQGLLGVLFAQLFGFHLSLSYSLGPDNPCPSGEVNRVVQGVNIHPFNSNIDQLSSKNV